MAITCRSINQCMSRVEILLTTLHIILGEFGIVYKAHIPKHKDGQVITEIMAVKTLKGKLPDKCTQLHMLK